MVPVKYVLGFGDLCGHYHKVLVPCVLGSCIIRLFLRPHWRNGLHDV
jgi:hypothetical protein